MEFNFEGKTGEELEARKLELRDAMTAEGADLDAIESEARAINAELEARKAENEKKNKEIREVLEKRTEPIEKNPVEEKHTMLEKEIRSSKEYIDAYVRYLKGLDKTGSECRALLSENAPYDGIIPVPSYVEGRIQTAWEKDEILSKIKKTYLKGNVRVGVEMAATPADIHEEGTVAIPEEELTIAIVEIVASSIKKWIYISDEVLDLNGEAFLDYVYDEIEYQIVKLAATGVLVTIFAAPTTGISKPIVSIQPVEELALDDIVQAIGKLSGDARNLVFIANRATIAAYQGLAMAANYAVDIFAGVTVIPTDSVPAYSVAGNSDDFAIVGDLSAVQGNFPNGDSVKFTFDPYSQAEADLVKIVGRMYGGFGLVRNKAFTVLVKKDGNGGGGE